MGQKGIPEIYQPVYSISATYRMGSLRLVSSLVKLESGERVIAYSS